MFQFTAFALCYQSDGSSNHRVAPFGHLWISPCQRVPTAFRRLPRPSSPSEALGIPQTPFCCVRIPLNLLYWMIITRTRPPPRAAFVYLVATGCPALPLSLQVKEQLVPPCGRTMSLTNVSTKRNVFTVSKKTHKPAPKRRCSSRTFRYGYLVTT